MIAVAPWFDAALGTGAFLAILAFMVVTVLDLSGKLRRYLASFRRTTPESVTVVVNQMTTKDDTEQQEFYNVAATEVMRRHYLTKG